MSPRIIPRLSVLLRPSDAISNSASGEPTLALPPGLAGFATFHNVYLDLSSVGEDRRIQVGSITGQNSPIAAGRWLSVRSSAFPGEKDLRPLCLTDPTQQRAVAEAMHRAASRYDDLLIDDFSDFGCDCAGCKEKKGKRTWGEFRRGESLSYARKVLLSPALAVNPKARLTLRIPPDADTLFAAGYNVLALSQLFHRVTIARPCSPTVDQEDGHLGEFGVIQTCRLFRWMQEEAGRKMSGAEIIRTDSTPPGQEISPSAAEQAVALTLSGVSELLLDGRDRPSEARDLSPLADEASELAGLARVAARTPVRGIALYRPRNAPTGEGSRVPDRLSLLGFPLRPTPRFPSSSRSAFFTLEALADSAFPEKLHAYLRQGVACVTASLSEALRSKGFNTEGGDNLRVWPHSAGVTSDETARHIDKVRDILLTPLGLSYAGPSGVTLHLFGHRDFVLQNFNDTPAPLRLNIPHRQLRISSTSDPTLEVATELTGGEIVLGPHYWIHLNG